MSDQLPKVLITGGSGLIGTRTKELLNDKYQFHDASLETGVDLLKPDQLHTFLNAHSDAHTLIHLAAYTNVKEAQNQDNDQSGLCYKLNVDLTDTLAKHCQQHNIHLIYISTGYVFDGEKPANLLYIEDDEPNPLGWYGMTKYLGELKVKESKAPYTICRIETPFGPAFETKPDWIQAIVSQIKQDKLYPMFSDKWLTPTFIDDIPRALDSIMQHGPANHTYHLVSSTQLTPFEAAKQVAAHLHADVDHVKPGKLTDYIAQNPSAEKLYPRNTSLSNTYFQTTHNFKFTDFADALTQILSQ